MRPYTAYGKVLSTYLRDREMTQEDLAKPMGLSVSAISQYFNGKRSPAKRHNEICRVLKLNKLEIAKLYNALDPEKEQLSHGMDPFIEERNLSFFRLQTVIEQWNSIPIRMQENIYNMVTGRAFDELMKRGDTLDDLTRK